MRRKVVSEEEQRDSGGEQRGDEDDIPLGPQSNISLLDQHQHLKEKAEGRAGVGLMWGGALLGAVGTLLLSSYLSPARKESAKEKQLKEEEKILESVAEGRGEH